MPFFRDAGRWTEPCTVSPRAASRGDWRLGKGCHPGRGVSELPHAPSSSNAASMAEESLDLWLRSEVDTFLASNDEARFRRVLADEGQRRRAQAEPIMRSYNSTALTGAEAASGPTLVIAFGGLQQRIGGGKGGGVAPYEFVRTCRQAGATHALFVRDTTTCVVSSWPRLR